MGRKHSEEQKAKSREEQKAKSRERSRLWSLANPEAKRNWRIKNRTRTAAYTAATAAKHKSRVLKNTYGITSRERDLLFALQGSCCACCGDTDPRHKRGWRTDHDHTRGLGVNALRGILCNPCNSILGYMGDDLAGVKRFGWVLGVRYLEHTAVIETPARLAIIFNQREVSSC